MSPAEWWGSRDAFPGGCHRRAERIARNSNDAPPIPMAILSRRAPRPRAKAPAELACPIGVRTLPDPSSNRGWRTGADSTSGLSVGRSSSTSRPYTDPAGRSLSRRLYCGDCPQTPGRGAGGAGSVDCSVIPVGLRDLAGGWAYQASVGSTLTASQRGDARMVAMRVGLPAT